MLKRLLTGAVLCAAFTGSATSAEPYLDLKAGGLRFTLGRGRDARLTANGVTIFRDSTLYIVNHGWTRVFYDQDNAIPQVESRTENGVQIGTARYASPDATAEYVYEIHPDNTFRVTLTYECKVLPARAEHTAALWNADVLAGVPYDAQTVAGPRAGRVPETATTSNQTASRVTPYVKQITFQTAVGEMEVAVQSDNPDIDAFNFWDARKDSASSRYPVFWFGLGSPAREVSPGKNTVQTTYRFRLKPVPPPAPPLSLGNSWKLPLIQTSLERREDLPVIPRPKNMTLSGKPFRFAPVTIIQLPVAPDPEEEAAAWELQAFLRERWGVSLRICQPGETIEPGVRFVEITLDWKMAEDMRPKRPEGYRLSAAPGRVEIVGADARGVYHGAQTLKQLVRRDAGGVYVPGVVVDDWPSLGFRGVHWFGGPQSLPFHQKMIRNILAPLKMNAMVFQADYTQWETQPKVWHAQRSTPKADVKAAAELARKHFIEPIPMVNGMGHAEWLFHNGQNRDFVADPNRPFAYDPTNPRSYEALFGVMQEAIDLFQPIRYFHIGNDEVTAAGQFPPRGVSKSVTDLAVEDTNRRYSWLKERGLKTMMWSDMFLHGSEASSAANAPSKKDAVERRAGIPKDIVINDWHYKAGVEDYRSLRTWQSDGFPVIGTPWWRWDNIRLMSRQFAGASAMGMLQSTWAGYAMSLELVDGPEYYQFVPYLLAAEWFWNGGEPPAQNLRYSPEDAFQCFWNPPAPVKPARGFAVDLSTAAPSTKGLPALPRGRVSLGGDWWIAGPGIRLAGPLSVLEGFPGEVTIPLSGERVSEMRFLWGTVFHGSEGTVVAHIRITYKNGEMVEVPVRYGQDIRALGDTKPTQTAPAVWIGPGTDGSPIALRRFIWRNSNPTAIESITISSAHTEVEPVIAAVTGVSAMAD